jgi:spermidine synthase
MRPWHTVDRAPTAEGELVLQSRGDEFVIAVGGRIVMSNRAHRSETELARLVCDRLAEAAAPRVVVAGLGMGFTLRAALDVLPGTARVTVVELTPAVVGWCHGRLAALSGNALSDARVTTVVGDVFATLRELAVPVDGVALDLWQGPLEKNDPVFTAPRLAICRRATGPGGRLGVWSEQSVGGFEQRLSAAGFVSPAKHVARRGFRHVVYVADAPSGGPDPKIRPA